MSVISLRPSTITARANADLSAKQFFVVKLSSTAGYVALAGAGEGDAVLMNTPASEELADIAVMGGAKVKLGGTVTRGQYGKSDASGKIVAATTDKDRYIVKILESGVDGDIVSAIVCPGYLAA